MRRNERTAGAFGAVFLAFALLLCAPGLVVTFLVDRALDLGLDRGQLWMFGATVSLAIYGACRVLSTSAWRGFTSYALLCFSTTWGIGLARWGFHVQAATDFSRAVFP